MNILEEITIDALWGEHRAHLTLRPDVNFLIGPNGCGKTTIINLVVAALTADFRPLVQTPFKRIIIKMKEVSGRRKPIIQLDKQRNEKTGAISILYKIKDFSTAESEDFLLEDIEELRRYRFIARRHVYTEGMPDVRGLKRRLSTLFDLTWLSIHRSRSFRHQEDEDSYDSSVDNKLADMCNEFVRFFSELAQSASLKMKQFQETVFLSMLVEQKEEAVRNALRRMDLEAEKRLLIDIYNELEIDPKHFRSRVESHFRHVKNAFDRLENDHHISMEDFATLITNIRTHQIVQEWNKVAERQDAIYAPREVFLKIINTLMPSKKFSLNSKNELTVSMASGRSLQLHNLSSGEKQMLIILGEALLQRSVPAVYIADEPELSLHVEWQESLIDNVRTLNPKAQILFATHSPDIVGKFSKGVHDVRKVLK